MTKWFLLPHRNENDTFPGGVKIITALEALVAASTSDGLQQVLEERQEVLFSQSTLLVLCLTIDQQRISGEAQVADKLHAYLRLLEDARANSIREACQRFSTSAGQFEMPASRTIELLTEAMGQTESATYPYLWAELHCIRGDSYMEITQEEMRAEHVEQAIADYDTALTVFTQDNMSGKHAQAHIQRGLAYSQRIRGERAENLEQAIADLDVALSILKPEETAADWASAHMFRGLIYIDRIKGERDDNLERAIADLNDALNVFTPEEYPAEWALLHLNRGFAYLNRERGERAGRMEQAITDFDTALSIFTQEQEPLQWAAIHKNLGAAYTNRAYGDLRENLNQAVAHYEAALTVFTDESLPYEYREIQYNLAQIYIQLKQAEEAQQAFAQVRRVTSRLMKETSVDDGKVGYITTSNDDNRETYDTEAIASAIKALLETKNWPELAHLLRQQQRILLSDQSLTLLRNQVAEAEETTSDGQSEFLRMRLQLLENARANGIEAAWQGFTSDFFKAAEALQMLQMVHSYEEVSRRILEQQEVYLSTPVLALMYSAIEEYRANNNIAVVSLLEQTMRYLMSIKQGKIVVEEQPQKTQQERQKGSSDEAISQQSSNTIPPGIVKDIDLNDPYIMLLMQEMQQLTREQLYAIMPLMPQMGNLLQGLGMAGMDEASTRILEIIDRKTTPYLWASMHFSRIAGYLDHPHGNNKQALDDCNDALSVFTSEVIPQMWAYTHLIRACVYMNPIINEQANTTKIEEQKQPLEQALDDFNAALSIITREKMPLQWAMAMGTRGFAYAELERITGNIAQNIEQARADFAAALSVLSVEGVPMQRAIMYMYRAIMYSRLTVGDRKRNIELAIADCNSALAALSSRISQEESELWASVLMVRGLASTERIEGERAQNLEQALADFNAALTVRTRTHLPQEWATTMVNRGTAYMYRLEGDRRQNLEQALADYTDALEVLTLESTPIAWGQALANRGTCYNERIVGDRGQNQEQALADFSAALSAFLDKHKHMRIYRAEVLVNRGSLYLQRIAGERRQNFVYARDDFDQALTIFSPTETPLLWAQTLINRAMTLRGFALGMGLAYRGWGFRAFANRLFGERQLSSQSFSTENEQYFEKSLADLDAALVVLDRETTPREWAVALRERAHLHAFRMTRHFTGNKEHYVQQAIADFSAALTVLSPSDTPFDWAITLINRALLFQQRVEEGYLEDAELALADTEAAMIVFTREVAPANYRRIQNIRALVFERLGHWEEAHSALLAAREVERDYVAAAISDVNRSDIISDFALVDIYVRDARAMLHFAQPNLAEVAIALEEGRTQGLRATLELDTITPQRIQDPSAQERAMIFLAARNRCRKYQHLILEPISSKRVALKELYSRELQEAYAAYIEARNAIRQHDNPDFMTPVPTLESIARAINTPGEALIYLVADSSLDGTNGMAIIVTRSAKDTPLVLHVPLPKLKDIHLFDLLDLEENTHPTIRAKEAITKLGELGLNDLTAVLHKDGIRRITLVTYGWLSVFPLSAVFVSPPNQDKRPLGEIFEVTFAPSARAAEIAYKRSRLSRRERPLLLMAGNSQPLPQHINDLPFAAAEAYTIQRIAKEHGYPSDSICYLKSRETKKEKVVEALRQAWYAHLAVHGEYKVNDPRRSRLVLAGTQAIPEEERNIYLGEALDGKINVSGLRLLVLSACETTIIDTSGIPDEMLGLASGFLQAGVAGVIASLWAVNDYPTYLLMCRFAQLYLDPQGIWSPARALAEAQRWLREEATYRVLTEYDPSLTDKIKDVLNTEEATPEPVGVRFSPEKEVIPSRLRSLSLTHKDTLRETHLNAALRAMETPDELPYKGPEHWAAFIVTGC